jgi:hypothetical protein
LGITQERLAEKVESGFPLDALWWLVGEAAGEAGADAQVPALTAAG